MIGNNSRTAGKIIDIETIIGQKSDEVGIPYVENVNTIMAYLVTGYYHVHGQSFLFPYRAAPVTLNSSAAEWSTEASPAQIMAAGDTTKTFDLHWASVSSISVALDGIIDFYSGPDEDLTWIGAVDVVRTVTFSRENAMPLQIKQQPAGTRISAIFSDSTSSSRSCRVKVYGHYYE